VPVTFRVGLVAIIALIAVLIGIGFYVLNVVFSDRLNFQQSDIAYSIVVTSRTIRDFPRFTATGGDVDYTYSARDGTAPGQIVMAYHSNSPADDLDRKYRTYCVRRSYSAIPKNELFLDSRLGCDATDYRIEVNFQQRKESVSVTVVFLEK